MSELIWKKPMRCDNSSPNCVEVAADTTGRRFVRDSKNPTAPALAFSADEWDAFEGSIRGGQTF